MAYLVQRTPSPPKSALCLRRNCAARGSASPRACPHIVPSSGIELVEGLSKTDNGLPPCGSVSQWQAMHVVAALAVRAYPRAMTRKSFRGGVDP